MTTVVSRESAPSLIELQSWALITDEGGQTWIGAPSPVDAHGFLTIEPAYRYHDQAALDHEGRLAQVQRTAIVPFALVSARQVRVRPASLLMFRELRSEDDFAMLQALVAKAEASRPKTHGERRMIVGLPVPGLRGR